MRRRKSSPSKPRLGGADDVATEVGWRNVRAMLLAQRGQHAEAETLAREAVERATGTEYVRSIAESYLALAEVLRLAKRRDAATDAMKEALRLYEAKGFVLSAAVVHARHEKLQVSSPSP